MSILLDASHNISTVKDPPNPESASDWSCRSTEMAHWVLRMVVRADCHGAHTVDIDEHGEPNFGRTTRKTPLTQDALEKHFAAVDGSSVLGLHITSPEEQCLFVVVDIDAHGKMDDDPEKNWMFARHVFEEARRLGFACLLLDSNGRGGFHVWVLLGRMAPMAQAYRLGKYLVRGHEMFGLTEPPESFPKSPHLTGKRFGSWVRIMGRHHKRPFWTRVWDEQCERWGEGEAAVELILGTIPVPVDVAEVLPTDFSGEPPRPAPADGAPVRPMLGYGQRRGARLAREALPFLRGGEVDHYDVWLEIGMCLAELGDDGLGLWSRWSEQSTKCRPGETRAKWASFQAGAAGDRRTVGLGTLFRRAESYGFKGHLAARRWAEYQERGSGVLDEGEDPGRLADEARDQRFSYLCDEAVATLEARPDLRAELAAAWGVSAETTRKIGAGLRQDMERWLDLYMPTGRWAITVPLSAVGDLTVGYVRLYPGEVWKSRLAWDSRPGLVLPWDLEARDGPIVVCGDPADTARALELGGRAVGLAEPDAPLDELAAFVTSGLASGRDIIVAPGKGRWADETAYHLGQLTGRSVKVMVETRSLHDCVIHRDTKENGDADN